MKNILIRSIATAAGRLALAAVSALVIAACAEDISPETATPSAGSADNPNAITFTVSDSAAYTRTAEGTIDRIELRTLGFGVFAAHTGLHKYANSSISSNFMYNEKVTYDTDAKMWTYNPVKYWPNAGEPYGSDEYISFFAYGPYTATPGTGTDNASRCITDYVMPYETGDPWLVYQLGGDRDDWKDHQVDLLYAVNKDQKKEGPSAKINFNFKHALAGAGDKLTITCSSDLQNVMKSRAATQQVFLQIDKVIMNYRLTKKAKLILNNSEEPNWQEVSSENKVVHRIVEIDPNQVIAVASVGGGSCTLTDYTTSDLGIFYIPLDLDDNKQLVDISVKYTCTIGSDVYSGNVGCSKYLDNGLGSFEAGANQNFNIVLGANIPLSASDASDTSVGMRILDIPDQVFTGSEITPSVTVVDENGLVLEEGTDYTLSYANNISACLSTAANAPKVTATGINDYFGKVASKTFTITKSQRSINFSNASAKVKIDESVSEVTWNSGGADNALINTGTGAVVYSSSNESVATVNASTGTVTCKGAGVTVITARVADSDNDNYQINSASYVLTVVKGASISFASNSVTVNVADKFHLQTVNNTGGGTVTYSISDNVGIATIDPVTGIVKILGATSAALTVTAKADGGQYYDYSSASEATYTLTINP